MPRFYSMDLRARVMSDIAAGLSLRKTAAKYSVSKQWIQILKKRLRSKTPYRFTGGEIRGIAQGVIPNSRSAIQGVVLRETASRLIP